MRLTKCSEDDIKVIKFIGKVSEFSKILGGWKARWIKCREG